MRTSNTTMEEAPAKGDLKSLKPILVFLLPYKWHIAGAMLSIVFVTIAVLSMGAALRFLVDEGLGKGNGVLLNRAYIIMLGVIVLLAVGSYLRYKLLWWASEKVIADIRQALFKRLIAMDIRFFEVQPVGGLLSRLTTDTTLLHVLIGSSVNMAIRNTLLIIGGLIMLLATSGELTAYVLLIMPVVVLPILILGRKVRGLSRNAQARVADINTHAEEGLYAIRTIQALSLEKSQSDQMDEQVGKALEASLDRIHVRAFLTALVITLIFGAIMSVLWIGGHKVITGAITTGDLSAFVFYAVAVAGAVGALSDVISDVQRAAGAAERISELLDIKPVIVSPPAPVSLPDMHRAPLVFDAVSFTYPARPDHPALQHLDLTVAPGEKVAVVGPSGAGKSTLFQLLLRFYDPSIGAVRIGGHDIRELDLAHWRGAIGLVPQEPGILTGTIGENIAMGRPGASEAEVWEAAKTAQAFEFINKLPDKLATPVGIKGVQLSGGQKQRLAIARAVLRNPGLLLLDEATSALDAENERLVQQGLAALMEGRTTLIIAHRLSTVLHADRIVLLNQGKIEAIGTHSQLILQSPLYAKFTELQLKAA